MGIQKTARFGGLGGEFFRHPYKIYYKNIFNGVINGIYNENYTAIKHLVNHDEKTFLNRIKTHLKQYETGKRDDDLKGFYFFEYYRITTGLNAEDRERIHFWSVHPLWSAKLVSLFAHRLPLKWMNYDFFSKVIGHIDERLLDVPIYKRDIKLTSVINRKKYDLIKKVEDFRYKYKLSLYLNLKKYVPEILNFYKKKKTNGINAAIKELKYDANNAMTLYNQLKYSKHIFNSVGIQEYASINGKDNIHLTTLLLYIKQLEERYPEKFILV